MCVEAHAHAHIGQQPLGSLDVSGNVYQCQNGVKPSITCTDSASEKPTCSCTCTNGIIFDQLLPATPLDGSSTAPDSCQAEKQEWLEREQQLSADLIQAKQELTREKELAAEMSEKQQQHLKREQELSTQLSTCNAKPSCNTKAFKYKGCYVDNVKRVLNAHYASNSAMTSLQCQIIFEKYSHFGLEYGNQCHCGNSLVGNPKKVGDGECSTA
ncbi:WSC-domain-containing protein [Stemphylium lycopersici]|uniref:WSC-domain-containing protein n=1 Tax=Stemphylium lycopersici TaxID=183478 RepID=A0A364N410_STELY|nr:WSC-domain-containing protein [Stemphylium lycopersici]RAR11423.1 WSC-domain-containing protein [Stemphylium lycopersici]